MTQELALGSGWIDVEISDIADAMMGDDCRQTLVVCLIERRRDRYSVSSNPASSARAL